MLLCQGCHKVTLLSLLVPHDVSQVINCFHEFLSSQFGLDVINLLSHREHIVITSNEFAEIAVRSCVHWQ